MFLKNRHKKYWEKFGEKIPEKKFSSGCPIHFGGASGAAPYYGGLIYDVQDEILTYLNRT